MEDAALTFYKSLDNFKKLQELIETGTTEGPFLECKSPTAPQLTRDIKAKLAEAISGYANSGGGVIIWGISTQKHLHSGLDVLTQIEPIGHCSKLAQEIDIYIPTLVKPKIQLENSKVIHPSKGDSKGIIVTYISPTSGDPVQSLVDNKFYIRSGAEFVIMPYEIIKKMFLSVEGPDIAPEFDNRIIKLNDDGSWRIPIVLSNKCSAVSNNTRVTVKIINKNDCQDIKAEEYYDMSGVNPGECLYIVEINKPIYRGLGFISGTFIVKMKTVKLPKRILKVGITIYADKMRARSFTFTIQLAKNKFQVKNIKEQFLY